MEYCILGAFPSKHMRFSLNNIISGQSSLKKEIDKGKESSKDVHKANLFSLIHCVDALDSLHRTMETDCEQYGWPLTTSVAEGVRFCGFQYSSSSP